MNPQKGRSFTERTTRWARSISVPAGALLIALAGITAGALTACSTQESGDASALRDAGMRALPYQVGQVVAGNDLYERKFLGVSVADGTDGYLVQEFYKQSGDKYTDPFVLSSLDDVTRGLVDADTPMAAELPRCDQGLAIVGLYTAWYPNGQKMLQGRHRAAASTASAVCTADGTWTWWSESGEKIREVTYQNGQQAGPWTQWWPSGQMAVQGLYEQSALESTSAAEGQWQWWWENGQLQAQGTFVNGQRQGQWTLWYDNGQMYEQGEYFDGRKAGPWQRWWRNGQLYERGGYDKGIRTGYWQRWNAQGSTVPLRLVMPAGPGATQKSQGEQVPFVSGDIVAGSKAYYRRFLGVTEKGFFEVQDFYRSNDAKLTDPYLLMEAADVIRGMDDLHGLYHYEGDAPLRMTGSYTRWHANGNQQVAIRFINGVPDGAYALWWENGQKRLQGTYRLGRQIGLWSWWREDGQLSGTGHYLDGLRSGEWSSWHGNGQLGSKGDYLHDERVGQWQHWDADGTLRGEASDPQAE